MVVLSGALFALLGTAILTWLPLAGSWRILVAAVWLGSLAVDTRSYARAYRSPLRCRLYADGLVELVDPRGGRRRAELEAGSLVLARIAWLRLRTADGASWGELVAGNARKNKDWRRLQVICRLTAAC